MRMGEVSFKEPQTAPFGVQAAYGGRQADMTTLLDAVAQRAKANAA